MSQQRPIVFVDFDGTICHDRYWRSLPPDKYAQLQAFLFGGDLTVIYEWMRGRRTTEAVNRLVATELGLPYDEVWRLFVTDCETMHVAPATLALIDRLRERATVILITGNMDSFSRFTAPALNLGAHFDVISNSYDEARLKTDDDGALFRHYAERFGIALTDCIVIDDSDHVCSVFAGLGGTSLKVTPDCGADEWIDILIAASIGADSFVT